MLVCLSASCAQRDLLRPSNNKERKPITCKIFFFLFTTVLRLRHIHIMSCVRICWRRTLDTQDLILVNTAGKVHGGAGCLGHSRRSTAHPLKSIIHTFAMQIYKTLYYQTTFGRVSGLSACWPSASDSPSRTLSALFYILRVTTIVLVLSNLLHSPMRGESKVLIEILAAIFVRRMHGISHGYQRHTRPR